jgi:hypothetical protein
MALVSDGSQILFTNLVSRLNGMVECGDRNKHIYQRAMLLVEQVKVSKGSPLVTCLLEGPSGRYCIVFLFK